MPPPPLLRPGTLLVTAAKGIERDTHLRMSQILEQETGGAFPIAALSGPSHAEEGWAVGSPPAAWQPACLRRLPSRYRMPL